MNMLNKKITHTRLRDKPDQKNQPKIKKVIISDSKLRIKKSSKNKSKEIKEPKYLTYLHEILQPVCMVCGTAMGIQLHHIKEASSDPKDDRFVIPLCHNHHLGIEFSAHGTAKRFREEYPYKQQAYIAQKYYEDWKK